MKKIKTFLLVDDNNSTNFFNKTIIQKTESVEEVLIAKNGAEAIEYIRSGVIPEVIFLDINMPVMNGWEFLDTYRKLNNTSEKTIIILMIGTELAEEDIEKARNMVEIKEFRDKMLTKEIVCDIISTYFENINSVLCSKSKSLTSQM
ncbi:response regulator [Aquimarina longa]|uniref:response regulator n=1 Tax=Aquimarina longa TaxID=1080221 RepID=UPI0007804EFB|nr:response regulator [Aquimarina longa]